MEVTNSTHEAKLLRHQIDFIFDKTTPFLSLIAGYRAGKTYALCYKILYMMSINTMADFALLEPTYGMITRVLIPTMTGILETHNIPYVLRKSEGHFLIDLGGVKKKCFLLSAENYQRAAGLTLSCFGIDECDLMNKEVANAAWNMMVSRLTKGEYMQGFAVSTPEGYNFCYEFFEENKDDDRRLIRASTYDNPFIDAKYFDNMAKTHTAQQLEAYLKGYFVNLTSGQVYYSFDRVLNHTDKTINDATPGTMLHLGIDFNVNVMATTVNIIDNGDRIFQIDELFGDKNTESLIRTIKTKYPNRRISVYPDATGDSSKSSASQSDIAMLRNAGFEVKVKSVNPRIKDRVNAVNAKLCNSRGERTFFINTRTCKQTTKTLEQQGYDKNGMPDKSGSGASDLSHYGDAAGYPIAYLYPVQSKMAGVIIKQ